MTGRCCRVAGLALALAGLVAGQGMAQQTGPTTPAATERTTEAQAADQPVLRIDFPETEAVPGQFLTLRMTVLVPTFMPDPPVWPSLEMPNLLVRLPEGASSPTSERIGGATWSGVSRRFQLSPMVPGDFTIPPQEIVVTWSETAGAAPLKTVLSTEAVTLRGTLPAGAAGLDPFLAAGSVELTEEIEGTPLDMKPGDSLTRTVTARIEGASPMFLPPLLPPADIPGVAAYPDDPTLDESNERGRVSGTRIERVTYVAEGGGAGTLPAVRLDWFDIDAGEVRSAQIEAVAVSVDGPVAVTREPRDWRLIAGVVIAVLVVLVLMIAVLRRLLPVLRRAVRKRRREYEVSERFAWRALGQALHARDTAAMRAAFDLWSDRFAGADPRRDPAVATALLRLGAARHAPANEAARQHPDAAWTVLRQSLNDLRAHRHSALPTDAPLPHLNPRSLS